MTKKQVIILGAGLMGRLIALACAKEGFRVSVYDQGGSEVKDSAAYTAAAMLAPLAESVATENNIIEMGLYSLNRWPELIKGLSKPVFFQQNGSLIVWHAQDQSLGKHFYSQLNKTQKIFPAQFQHEKITHEKLNQLENQLDHRFREALYLPHEGQLDNRELLDALLIDAQLYGAQFYWYSPRELSDFPESSHFKIIDCRGLGSKQSITPLRGVRGEVIRVYAPEVKLQRPIRLLHPRYPIYIAPKDNDVYVIGATEIESEDKSEVSVRSALELLSAAYSLHSGFAEGRILEMNAQCRPSLPNNAPIILKTNERIISINGLYRHGFMISPALLDAAMEMILTDQSNLAQQFSIESSLPHASNH